MRNASIKSLLVKDIHSLGDNIYFNQSIHGTNPMSSPLPARNRQWQILRHLLSHAGIDGPLIYDETGKPILTQGPHISVTHTGKAMLLSYGSIIHGIDMEVKGAKASKIKYRFCNEQELSWSEKFNDENIYTIMWCVKEAVFKYFGMSVDFRGDIVIEPTEPNYSELNVSYGGVYGKKKFICELSYQGELCMIHAICSDYYQETPVMLPTDK
ncbi:MAG: 4'-phosphopantetheinyl transferase family protein, partial [Flavobacteriales bacterium]